MTIISNKITDKENPYTVIKEYSQDGDGSKETNENN